MDGLSWSKTVFGFTVRELSRNLWRVKPYDYDDLIQEAFLVFLRVRNTYPEVTDPHLMSLYKTSLRNRINDIAAAEYREREARSNYAFQMSIDDRKPRDFDIDFGEGVRKRVLDFVTCEELKPPYGRRDFKRETTAEYCSRVLGEETILEAMRGMV